MWHRPYARPLRAVALQSGPISKSAERPYLYRTLTALSMYQVRVVSPWPA
ncbi:MAG TPA: hypothetical protein VER55_14365 [Ardenticatenaceae bacterium]|nr:hypothetical protein [Ardenticatenaceae bacterium]